MDIKELSQSFSFSPLICLTLTVFLLQFTCTSAEGQLQVIGSPHPIVATPGDDVILPCHVEPPVNVAGLTVEWSRPDLRPYPNDLQKRVGFVHLYRDSREVLDMKISSYVLRTALFLEDLRRGNISLKITNVTLTDEGRYRCFIPKLKSLKKSSIVNLEIDQSSTNTSTETPLNPKNLRTPGPTEEMDSEGDVSSRSRLALLFAFLLIVAFVVGGFLVRVCVCEKKKKKVSQTLYFLFLDSMYFLQ
ncbi:myelin-oligodendrocyte glycoprotein-like isoform X2 [Seriola aureovittata]|uniref:myelin-oligodendrocyte glycoprotein-like isoform X2 n=1 Tax=Seriola aureovittata TaxID=2871759 RepID=UPI0024BDBDD1|nr:myelin-oligodendrocyte glycoprotein-like isoform X2 [Seriola aureovittata]